MQVNRPSPPKRPSDDRLFLRDAELDRGVVSILLGERALNVAVSAALSASGLNTAEMRALMVIRATPDLNVSELRGRLGATTPTLARTLGELDRKGLIDRTKSEADGRRRRLRLTAAGETVAVPLVEALRGALREAYREAGAEDVSGFRRVLDTLGGGAP